MRVLFFGDSITQGFYDEQGGWAQRLINELHMRTLQEREEGRGTSIFGFNLGISDDTAETLLNRIADDIKPRHDPDDETVIVIAIGTNDSIMRENLAAMDVYTFQETLEKIIDTAQKYTDKILLVGLPAVDESLTDPWKYSKTGKQWHNQRLDTFEDTLKQSAMRKQVAFVPIYDRFIYELEGGKVLLSDGLHPNEKGHKLMMSLVQPELDKLLS